jgi:hypothetical protein
MNINQSVLCLQDPPPLFTKEVGHFGDRIMQVDNANMYSLSVYYNINTANSLEPEIKVDR